MVLRIPVVLGHIHFPRELATGPEDSLRPHPALRAWSWCCPTSCAFEPPNTPERCPPPSLG